MLEVVDKGGGRQEFRESIVDVPDSSKPLQMGGTDPDRKIAVEFVSRDNYSHLGGTRRGGTVEDFKFKAVAEHVAAEVKKQSKDHVFFGVFYDPSLDLPEAKSSEKGDRIDWETAWKNREEQGKVESKKLLRQQAQDFVAWLKEQKAIQ